jgi:hypothetical protein
LIVGQGEKMKYHLVIGGPKSGSAFVASGLVDTLNAESANSAILVPWGRYKNWKGKFTYDLETFQTKLTDTLADKPQVEHVVVFGPGLVFNTVLNNTDLSSAFPLVQKYFVKRDLRATETQMIADLLPTVESYQFLRRSQDPRLENFVESWNAMVDSYFTKFDLATQSLSFGEYGSFIVNQGTVTVSTAQVPEIRTIRLAVV